MRGLLPLLSLVLVSCVAVVPTVTEGTLRERPPNFDKATLALILADGPFPTEVHGNPSELDQGTFEDLVLRRLRLPAVWGAHRFDAARRLAPNHQYRIVLVFNPELDRANSPAQQPNAVPFSAGRHEFAMCRGDIRIHSQGPYPPLPSDRLERIRSRRLSPISPRFFEERLLVRGALCLGDVPVSASFVEVQKLDDYDAPEFDRLLAQLLIQIAPYRDTASE